MNVFSKAYTEMLSREIFGIDFLMKSNLLTHKTKDLNRNL